MVAVAATIICWFRDHEIVKRLLNDDEFIEQYYGNEGSPNTTLTFPDDLNLDSVGFRFSDADYR